MQQITSAATSINQIPALLKAIDWTGVDFNLDIGGGKYDTASRWLQEQHGVCSWVYDPYNRDHDHNQQALVNASKVCDRVTLANVLNVIPDAGSRLNVLQLASSYGCPVYISVYEGDRTRVGRETSKGWQENRPIADYLEEISRVFSNVTRKGKVIIAIN